MSCRHRAENINLTKGIAILLLRRLGELLLSLALIPPTHPARCCVREQQSFVLTIPHPREACAEGAGVVLEVYDGVNGEPREFLGQVG